MLFAQMKRSMSGAKGQNLVELLFTLPLVFVFILFIVELGRVWFTYEGAKMAANEGVHAASLYHNPKVGKSLLDDKLGGAGLEVRTAKVSQIPNRHAYQADVTVRFTPLFGSLSMPTMGGTVRIFPVGFDIKYQAISEAAIY